MLDDDGRVGAQAAGVSARDSDPFTHVPRRAVFAVCIKISVSIANSLCGGFMPRSCDALPILERSFRSTWRTSRDFERTNVHLRLRPFALQKVGDALVEGIPVLEHEPVPALPEDVHLHVREACQ